MFDLLPPPLGYRKEIPLYYPKTEEEIKADSYEIYNPNVIRSCRNFYEGDYGRKLLEKVEKHLSSGVQSIAELGCGSGYLIGHLAEKNPHAHCVGFDYSYQMLKMAAGVFKNTNQSEITIAAFQNGMSDLTLKTKKLANLNYALSDACVTPLSDHSIDFCFSCFLFDRVADPELLIQEKIRVTRSGGKITIISPFNYLSSAKWSDWYPIEKVIENLESKGVKLQDREQFTLDELLDVRKNKVVWTVECLTFVP